MTLSIALKKLLNFHQTGGPVIDNNSHVMGFLSEQDMIHKLLKVGYYCQDTNPVEDCMHKEVVTITPDDNIIILAEQMLPGIPKVYPVCENGRLVGIVSRRDILKAIATHIDDCFHHPV